MSRNAFTHYENEFSVNLNREETFAAEHPSTKNITPAEALDVLGDLSADHGVHIHGTAHDDTLIDH